MAEKTRTSAADDPGIASRLRRERHQLRRERLGASNAIVPPVEPPAARWQRIIAAIFWITVCAVLTFTILYGLIS